MADTWGFPVNGTNNYTGIVGLLQRGEVEIGAAGLLIKETRMDMVDYAGEIVTFRWENNWLTGHSSVRMDVMFPGMS